MNILLHQHENVTTLSIIAGMLGLTMMSDVVNEVDSLLKKGHKKFIFDLSAVKLANSAGIGMMVTCVVKVRKNRGQLILAHLSDEMKAVFDMLHLTSVFTIANSTEEALAVLKPNKTT